MIRLTLAVLLPAVTVLAQIQPGHAVVAWKSPSTGVGGLTLVDPAGATTPITGLDPLTIGTNQYDGATSVLVSDDGTVFAGLGVDNRTGSSPANLGVRLIACNGSTATDVPFVTLQQVPPGQIWKVVDIRERLDGNLLIAATQIVLTSNPVGTPAVFTVNRTSTAVQSVPTTGMSSGILRAVADFGDRYVAAVEQSFFSHNMALQSLDFTGASSPFSISTLVSVGSFGGLERDLNGELVFGASFSGATSTVYRAAHTAAAARVPVPGGPASIGLADVNPSGILSSFTFAGALSRTDTVLGGTTSWASTVASDPVAISVRNNPQGYTPTLPNVAPPMLASQGGVPSIGNAAFAFRLGEPSGQAATGILAGGFGRAVAATAYGTLLVQPSTLVTLGVVGIPANQAGVFALPIPNSAGLRGLRLDFQDAVLLSSPFSAALSNGLEITLQ